MGCGGSKADVHQGNHRKQLESGKNQDQNLDHGDGKEDEEIQVLQHGKSMPKSKLDELTENNSLITKKTEKSQNESITIKQSPQIKEDKPLELNSKTFHEPKIHKTEQKKDEDLHKAQTSKVEFDKHPHEFDFSFIEEKPKHNNEHDLLTDQVLKEMSELN
ncbi:hypothetical protein SteCoe_30914 [Stentor coeruleus]|uniref:Uncharacterized protein n=1 Tax=Stentor coeruleus TaxID=5963 RepID=A0A1R2B2L7_9CILI|nr:hypothetical protein SteCoe_30914 [Stentor coeruleus]